MRVTLMEKLKILFQTLAQQYNLAQSILNIVENENTRSILE